jgi:hypothetical protein
MIRRAADALRRGVEKLRARSGECYFCGAEIPHDNRACIACVRRYEKTL